MRCCGDLDQLIKVNFTGFRGGDLLFDHAWDRRSYDYGAHSNQLTAAADLIFHF